LCIVSDVLFYRPNMAEMRLAFPTFLYERHKIIFLPRFCLGWVLCLNILKHML
jgi:hypothetical protein